MGFLHKLSNCSGLLERLRAGTAPQETQREDRTISVARCILAGVSLVAIYLDPTEPSRYVGLAYTLLVIYVVYSLSVLLAARAARPISPRTRVGLHTVDILWVASITWFTTGPNSPFFVFSLFVLLAAAYRWGFRETLLSAAAVAVIPIVQAVAFEAGAGTGQNPGGFDLNRLIMRVTWLLLMGVLLGIMAEAEKLHRVESALVARLLSRIQSARGLREAMQSVLGELLRICGATRALLVLCDFQSGRNFLWTLNQKDREVAPQLLLKEIEGETIASLCAELPAPVLFVPRNEPANSGQQSALAFSEEGRRIGRRQIPELAEHSVMEDGGAYLAFSFAIQPEWSARLYFFGVQLGARPEVYVRLLSRLLRELSPAMHGLYLIRRLRWRAGSVERARVARELHDGVIQSLIAMEMEMEVLLQQIQLQSAPLAQELRRLQQQLRQEILNLRELLEQAKPIEIGPREMVAHLCNLIDRFQRDTGISVTFVCPTEELPLPPHVARETARILQEALVNVRKHSEARHVVVRLGLEKDCLKLSVDDNGRGFAFSGRRSQEELDAARLGPLIIKERVRSLGGALVVESTPGHGARLEISIPR